MRTLHIRDWFREHPTVPHLDVAGDGARTLVGAEQELAARPSWFRANAVYGDSLADIVQPDDSLVFGPGQHYQPVRHLDYGYVIYERTVDG
ncbi:MAG TPA: hypothetical protein VGP26_24485 [Actinophytocola sp.]|jgi:hypothetical protein|nr:hypothetical protein [Actinophytocola sp.]